MSDERLAQLRAMFPRTPDTELAGTYLSGRPYPAWVVADAPLQVPDRMVPGQEPYTREQEETRDALVGAAATALDFYSEDELEEAAEAARSKEGQDR